MEYRETASEEFQIPDQRTDRKLTFSFRLRVPAQLVDATPCRILLRQRSCGRTICLAVVGQYPARAALRLVQPYERFWRLFSMSGRF